MPSLRCAHLPWAFAAAVAIASALIFPLLPRGKNASPPLDWSALLRDETDAAPLDVDKTLVFPFDHGPHPGAPSENWRIAGTLEDRSDRRVGFQLSFSRLVLGDPSARASAWGTHEAYRARFSLTRRTPEAFHSAVRYSRAALGLAGFETKAQRLWVKDWSLSIFSGDNGEYGFEIHGKDFPTSLRLRLLPRKPPVEIVNTSGLRLYAISRLDASGTLEIDGVPLHVAGQAFLHHGFGQAPAADGPIVWDRIDLQLDDGRELLLLRSRRRDGSGVPVARAQLIDRGEHALALGRRELNITIRDIWRSPRTGAAYPLRWHIRIPAYNLDLRVEPLVADQEFDHGGRLWSGSVTVQGSSRNELVAGSGHMELSPY